MVQRVLRPVCSFKLLTLQDPGGRTFHLHGIPGLEGLIIILFIFCLLMLKFDLICYWCNHVLGLELFDQMYFLRLSLALMLTLSLLGSPGRLRVDFGSMSLPVLNFLGRYGFWNLYGFHCLHVLVLFFVYIILMIMVWYQDKWFKTTNKMSIK